MISLTRRALLAAIVFTSAAAACGGGPESKHPENAGIDVDGDALALLPGAMVGVAQFDAKAFFASGNAGSRVEQLVEKMFPMGEQAGFVASRDLDRVTLALYAEQELDAAAVVRGKFDEDKIAKTASAGIMTPLGAPVVTSQYAGRLLYTVANVGFTVLSDKTVIAGTEWGIRRTLDKLKTGKVAREVKPWMVETLDTKGAAFAGAVDLEDSVVAQAALQQLPVQFLQGMRLARVVGNFEKPGMQVAARLAFKDPAGATSAADSIRTLNAIGQVFVKLEDTEVSVEGNDVVAKSKVDDATLDWLLSLIAQLVPVRPAQSSGNTAAPGAPR